jgi:hypothetical protein
MAQKASNKNLIYMAVGGVALLVIGYVATAPSSSSGSGKPAPTKHSSTVVVSEDAITPEDLSAHFDRLSDKPHDAFKPLVYRVAGGAGGVNGNDPSAIPTEFTGGDAGWGFTGTVQIDGTAYANLENQKAGQFDQVKRGDHWKQAVVTSVGSDYVVMDGPQTSKKLLMPLQDTSNVAAKTTANNNPNNTPVMPDVNVATNVDASAAAVDPNTMTQGMGGFGRGRRGGGRGGRGGGGGGGFGGGFGGGGG